MSHSEDIRHQDDVVDHTVWIGLVTVRPRPDNDLIGDAVGGFVNVVALATDASSYGRIARAELDKYDFDVEDIRMIDTLERRKREAAVDPFLVELAESLGQGRVAACGVFYAYSEDED